MEGLDNPKQETSQSSHGQGCQKWSKNQKKNKDHGNIQFMEIRSVVAEIHAVHFSTMLSVLPQERSSIPGDNR
jgi:hypothetical protein